MQMGGYTYAGNNPVTSSDPSGLVLPSDGGSGGGGGGYTPAPSPDPCEYIGDCASVTPPPGIAAPGTGGGGGTPGGGYSGGGGGTSGSSGGQGNPGPSGSNAGTQGHPVIKSIIDGILGLAGIGPGERGICGSGLAEGGVMGTGSLCLVDTFNPSTGEFQFGGTASSGGGLGMVGAGADVGIQASNAERISDLGGPFGMGGGTASVGGGVTGDGFTGLGTYNQRIIGGDLGVGPSAYLDPNVFPMWEIHGGVTYTGQSTFVSFNVYHVVSDVGTGIASGLLWLSGKDGW